MRYTQLRAFHHVARHGGFSRAAEQLRQSQPSLSEQVGQLERDHDMLLFTRSNRKVVLTEAGERLFRLTRQFFEIEEAIGEYLDQSQQALRGTLRIMADSPAHISEALHLFRREHPRIQVDMRIGNSTEVLAALRNYEAEIGIFGSRTAAPDLTSVILGISSIIAIASPGYFDTPPVNLSFSALRELPLIFRERGSETQMRVVEAARQAGLRLTPSMVVEGREAMRDMVAQGFGIGFVSEAEIEGDTRLHRIALADGAPEMPETLAHLTSRQNVPMIRAFMRTLPSG